MSHFGNYMDDVPVKISEKYKRPPRIELPHNVSQCTLRAQSLVESIKYCYTFEQNVLVKLKELRSAKETRRNERRHRLQLLEEAKQKELDLIAAAEAEERLKQLSVSEVSYPSTEEISEISPDERTLNCDTNTVAEVTVSAGDPRPPPVSCVEDPAILQPVRMRPPANLLEDPDPLQELQINHKVNKVPHYNMIYNKNNIDKLTFSDFENDASNPFDNVALKTINDMELLAQVLQSQTESATSCPTPAPQYGDTYADSTAYPIQEFPPGTYGSQQPFTLTNGYYVPAVCDGSVPADNVNMLVPQYQYFVPADQYQPVDANYYNAQMPELAHQPSSDTFVPLPYYYNYSPVPLHYPSHSPIQNHHPVDNTSQNPSVNSTVTVKSRSRSVPDIVNEINEELQSAKLRASERSHNVSPTSADVTQHPSCSTDKKTSHSTETLTNAFEKLSSQQQAMCRQIQGMGFPLERVARVCSIIGDNDKKVIEGVLMVGQLLDLGFSEKRVWAALTQHGFYRDRALDHLLT